MKASSGETPRQLKGRLRQLVKHLADGMIWNWTRVHSERDMADEVLRQMATLGLIQHKHHRFGGDIWIVGRHRYGRTKD